MQTTLFCFERFNFVMFGKVYMGRCSLFLVTQTLVLLINGNL